MWIDRLSLRQRLLLLLLPPILLLIAIWTWGAYAIVLHFANTAYDWALEDTVQALAGQVKFLDRKIEVNLPSAARQMLEFDRVDKVYFSVADSQNRQLIGNRILPVRPGPDGSVNETRFYDDRLDGRAVRLVELRVPNEIVGDVLFVRIAETLHKREHLAKEVLIHILWPLLILLTGIVFLVWYGVGRGIAPLSRIRDAIAQRTHEDLSPLEETGLPAEVQEQVHVINDLMVRLGRTIEAQRRFIADATHQLRTPITVLRTQTELALRAENADEQRSLVTKMDTATARLVRLANQLLNLSRAEAGLVGIADFTLVEAGALIEDVVALLVPAALKKAIEVIVDIVEPVPEVRGDRQLLGEMLTNLVDNAIRYTQSGGRVEVKVRPVPERTLFIIADNGPVLPEPEREKVLQRFYRVVTVNSEGSGLGLAIAREIALLHGGSITLTPSMKCGTGLTVTVAIPISERNE
jgi:two-component system sensor histidine kinase TctE